MTKAAHHDPKNSASHPHRPAQIAQLYVKKEDGSIELFEQEKLKHSLVRAGAEPNQAAKIVQEIMHTVAEEVAYEGQNVFCTSADIYRRAHSVLARASRGAAARYSLKRSLLEFGPTGFPFEEYVAELFKAKWGYDTMTGQIVVGGCVPHEVDVVAWNAEKLVMAEVKYHSDANSKTDLKVALYVKARYDDIKDTQFDYGGTQQKLSEGWLVTNTRLTDTAITYGACKGLQMLSWDYPKEGNLQDIIEETLLHPITCLTMLNVHEKKELMLRGIVLVKTLYDHRKTLVELGLSDAKLEKLFEEIGEVMKTIPR